MVVCIELIWKISFDSILLLHSFSRDEDVQLVTGVYGILNSLLLRVSIVVGTVLKYEVLNHVCVN